MELFRKYTHPNSNAVFECVAELDNGLLVLVYVNSYGSTYAIVVSKEKAKEYQEYIEPPKPVIHERWIAYYRNSGGIFAIMSKKEPTKDVLHKEKVTFIEYPEIKKFYDCEEGGNGCHQDTNKNCCLKKVP